MASAGDLDDGRWMTAGDEVVPGGAGDVDEGIVLTHAQHERDFAGGGENAVAVVQGVAGGDDDGALDGAGAIDGGPKGQKAPL